uniref:EOG090X07PD n=1 Tax=Daphnia similis TaxID=35528 RepID=A0A4Y7N4P3_9CRUS|nr:EOG090X07PD [Daphnia similis]SVE86805.1 EOG090X07PD [Daphnia similis]SVE88058.1 EOG090X07PD [Daphnia similis]
MTDEKYKMMGSVPADISVVRFATVRAQEIVALTKMIENPQTTKLIFQKLPCHMRRRAMSHNPNRMPRLLREAHKSQMAKSGPALKPKRPRRKYRRRPSRLLEEYKRRSSKISWLETHLWHAKRFHMTVKWGYRLPEKSCARGHRFCYRSVAEHCLLMDTSYLCCVEIQGPQEAIVHGLAPLCDPKTGPTFGASSFLNGTREGRVMVFQRNSFVRGPIGLVTFLWRHGETPDLRTLWIWCHPAFYEQFLVELNSTYGLDSDSLIEHTNIKITLNKGKLNRLRLRGPFAHSVLSNLLDKDIRRVFVASQSPGFVTGVDVRDPRMILPQSRVKEHTSMPTQCETILTSRSRLWDARVRDKIAQVRTSFPDYIVNSRRSKLLVPGSELPLQPEEIPIPLLIVNASHESSDFVPGCDVIFPAGWATAFWLALIYSGGHAGGLKDMENMNFEYRICRDLCLEVDSDAGKTAAAEQKVKLMEDYFRRPPKTRTNFIKLATPFPFSVDWNRLLIDWDYQVEQGFTVLRDKKLLNTLSLKKQNLLSEFTFSHPHLVAVTIREGKGMGRGYIVIRVMHVMGILKAQFFGHFFCHFGFAFAFLFSSVSLFLRFRSKGFVAGYLIIIYHFLNNISNSRFIFSHPLYLPSNSNLKLFCCIFLFSFMVSLAFFTRKARMKSQRASNNFCQFTVKYPSKDALWPSIGNFDVCWRAGQKKSRLFKQHAKFFRLVAIIVSVSNIVWRARKNFKNLKTMKPPKQMQVQMVVEKHRGSELT